MSGGEAGQRDIPGRKNQTHLASGHSGHSTGGESGAFLSHSAVQIGAILRRFNCPGRRRNDELRPEVR